MSLRVTAFAVFSSRVYGQDLSNLGVNDVGGNEPRLDSGGHASPEALSFAVPSEEGWHGVNGSCKSYITDDSICFSDNGQNENYESGQECEFAYVGDATLTWEQFDLEDYYYHGIYNDLPKTYYECTYRDYIIVDDTIFCGVEEPGMTQSSKKWGGYYHKAGVGNFFAPNSKTFDVTGVTRFKFGTDSDSTYKGFTICAPKPEPAVFGKAELIAWCQESTGNCKTCKGREKLKRGKTVCRVKPNKLKKCKLYKNNDLCSKIPGCTRNGKKCYGRASL